MTQPDFELFTANYRSYRSPMGTPVQISNGGPKWELETPLRFSVPLLYPAWSLVKDRSLPVAAFREKYWAGLDKIGVARITEHLQRIADAGDHRLVLMCHEKNPADCHRGDFAIWWEKQTGTKITEATVTKPPPVAPVLPPSLFDDLHWDGSSQ